MNQLNQLKTFLQIGFAILLTLILCTPVQDGDVFFYLSLGRLFFENGQIPAQDPFLYTFKDWNILHQWLSFPVFYAFQQAFAWWNEVAGLVVLRMLLWAGIFQILFIRSSKWNIQDSFIYVLFLFSLVAASYRFIDRASTISDLILIGLTALLLDRDSLSRRTLIALPFVFALWVNLHAGFIIGLAFFSAYVVAQGKNATRALWLCLGASYLACLINPRFFEGVYFPLYTAFKPEWAMYRAINFEWMPTFREPFSSTWEVKALVVLLVLSAMLMARVFIKNPKRNIFPVFAFIIYLYLAQNAVRFLATSSLGFVLLILYCIHEIGFSIPEKWEKRARVALAAIFIAAITYVGMNGYTPVSGHRRIGIGIDESWFPVGAVKFIEEKNLGGRIFNQYEWGSFLIWRMQPYDRLFIHTHIDDPKLLVNDYYGTGRTKEDFNATVNKYQIQFFLLDAKTLAMNPAPQLLSFLSDWKIIYQDSTAVLWARK
ncbi:MAG TPA: hypothetical protein VM432_14590 [Bdellovibrionales bacterium]|jgi:hypothetical protein|nr:hypothetical protein [Bdellovibrionales bacterium]